MEKTQGHKRTETVSKGMPWSKIIPKAGAPSAPGSKQQTFLRLQGVTVDRPSRVIYEVYLNLPAGTRDPSSDSPHFVSVMSLFGSRFPEWKGAARQHACAPRRSHEGGEEFVFDVTEVVVALARESVDLSRLNVTVAPRRSSSKASRARSRPTQRGTSRRSLSRPRRHNRRKRRRRVRPASAWRPTSRHRHLCRNICSRARRRNPAHAATGSRG